MKFYRLIIAICAVALISCGGAEERKAVYLEKAKASITAGDYEKARIDLRNVLQIDPKDGKAYYLLGSVFENLKDYQKAYRNYLKAEELNPDLLANQASLGSIYLYLMNDMAKAQEKIDFILKQDPDNSGGLLLKAGIMIKQGNVKDATALVEQIVKKDPSHIDASLQLAGLYIKDEKLAKAISILDTSLNRNPGNVRLTKVLALVLVKNKDYKPAEIIFKKNLEKNPNSTDSYNILAAFYNDTGDKAKAEQMLRDSIDNDPDDADRYITLIKYIVAEKGKKEAIDQLNKFVKAKSNLGKLRMALAESLYINGDRDKAIDVYKKAVNDFSEEVTGINARLALISIYLQDRNIEKAKAMVDETIEISPNNPKANLYRAKIALHDKDMEKAIISLRIVTKETPENIEAYLLLVNIYKLTGDDELARSALHSVHELNKLNPDGLLKLSQYYLTRDINEAKKIIDEYNRMKESDYDGLSIKASILNYKKEYVEAYEIAKILMEKYPKMPNGYLQATQYYVTNNDEKQAISTLEKGYLNVKENRKILSALSVLQASDGQFDVAEKRLLTELKATPDDNELKLLLSKIYLAGKKIKDAETLLNEIVESNYVSEEPYLLLSDIVYKNTKDLIVVKSILLNGKKNVPSSIKIPFKLASLYESEKDYASAINVYRELLKVEPDNVIIRNNLLSLLSDHGDNKEDLKASLELTDKLIESGQPVFLDTVGWVYYKLGENSKAVEFLTQVVESAPEVNVFNFHLGMAYKQTGKPELAKTYLEKSLADNKPFNEKSMAETALKEIK